MWNRYLILFGLLSAGLAHADDSAPTADNWEAMQPERCAPDPIDSLELTPLLFPPQFETYTESESGTDVLYYDVRDQFDKDGKHLGRRLFQRIIPDVSNPIRRRRLSLHYVAFLNSSGALVDEMGQRISEDNPVRLSNRNLAEGQGSSSSWTLWERFDDAPTYQSPAALATYEGHCEYFMEQTVYRQKTMRIRSVSETTGFMCKDGGGYVMKSPEVSENLIRKHVVHRPNTITFWNHEGQRFSGPSAELVDTFNALTETGKCQWKKARY